MINLPSLATLMVGGGFFIGADMGLDLSQLKALVVMPALAQIGLMSTAAANLVTGTAAVESGAAYLHQLGTGPAMGLWQMEPATHDDLWLHVITPSLVLARNIGALLAAGTITRSIQLVGNLPYAAAMCRLKYHTSPDPLPSPDDAAGMAAYWKRVYNTSLGAGVVDPSHVDLFQAAINA